MKLYYSPGACSLSPHIVAKEAGMELALERVDLATKKTEFGHDFMVINPKGYVPAVLLDDGTLLTEGPAIVQYLADRRPATRLIPASDSPERYRVLSWLAYINSELHKSFSPLFNPASSPEVRAERTGYLKRRFAHVDQELSGKSFLMGEQFTVADAYLFTVANWAGHVKLDLSACVNLGAFLQRVAARPAVQAALKAEGLV